MSIQCAFVQDYYLRELVKRISAKYGLSHFEALRRFLFSKTYAMMKNEAMAMWDFSPIGIFDIWESEMVTGDPRNSIYIRGE